jgi:hypothetical protein
VKKGTTSTRSEASALIEFVAEVAHLCECIRDLQEPENRAAATAIILAIAGACVEHDEASLLAIFNGLSGTAGVHHD